ncbi:hypothetical protein ABT288_28495 [Streptomyces sp. NPDC001093]|uniref:hypothetical protein n=1 Tax=Streptomyces sp. NPDC001093 TaxID=3154376 RepID=UPI003319D546
MADCQPLACRNTALTLANLQALADGDHLAPYIRHRLQEQHSAAAVFLARHDPEPAE